MVILSIKIDLKSEKEKIYQMHHDIRMNALIALLVKKPQNISINSHHEKVCFLNLFIAEMSIKKSSYKHFKNL